MAAGPTQLRNAYLIQLLMLLVVGAGGGMAWFLGPLNPASPIIAILAGVTVTVLCVWSLVISIRAARAGSKWRWAGIVWALVGLELAAPSADFWYHALNMRTNSMLMPVLLGVVLPFFVITGIFVALAAILSRNRAQKRVIYGIVALLYAPIPLLIVPGALYLVAVLSSFEQWGKSNENWVMRATPDLIKDVADRICDRPSFSCNDVHILLCQYGWLSHERMVENLESPVCGIAFASWCNIEKDRLYAIPVGMSVASAKIVVKDEKTERAIGEYLSIQCDKSQLAEIFNNVKRAPKELIFGLIIQIENRTDIIQLLESCVLKGELNDLSAILCLEAGYKKLSRDPAAANSKADVLFSIYRAWSALSYIDKNTRGKYGSFQEERRQSLVQLLSHTHDNNAIIYRIAAFALATVLRQPLQHSPYAQALTDKGTPVPVTLDESEEIESLCNKAEAEIARLSEP